MTLNDLYSRFDKLTNLALVIPEFDDVESLANALNGPAVPAIEAVTSLAGLLAADMSALWLEAEETSTVYLAEIGEAAAAAEALVDAAERVSLSNLRSIESFFNMSYVAARTFAAARNQLAQENLDGIFTAKAGE